MVKVKLNKLIISALVDTGASISCISQSVFQKSGLTNNFVQSASVIQQVTGVSGTVIPISGKVTIPITINNLTLVHTFYVLPCMNYNIILGLDFLTKQSAHLNFETNSQQLQNGMTEIPIISRRNKTHLVSTISYVTIPSKTETIIPVTIKGLANKSKRCGLIEPASFCINGARCLVQVKNNTGNFKIINPTDSDVVLKKDFIVGRFSHITQSNIILSLDDESPDGTADVLNTENTHDNSNIDEMRFSSS